MRDWPRVGPRRPVPEQHVRVLPNDAHHCWCVGDPRPASDRREELKGGEFISLSNLRPRSASARARSTTRDRARLLLWTPPGTCRQQFWLLNGTESSSTTHAFRGWHAHPLQLAGAYGKAAAGVTPTSSANANATSSTRAMAFTPHSPVSTFQYLPPALPKALAQGASAVWRASWRKQRSRGRRALENPDDFGALMPSALHRLQPARYPHESRW